MSSHDDLIRSMIINRHGVLGDLISKSVKNYVNWKINNFQRNLKFVILRCINLKLINT